MTPTHPHCTHNGTHPPIANTHAMHMQHAHAHAHVHDALFASAAPVDRTVTCTCTCTCACACLCMCMSHSHVHVTFTCACACACGPKRTLYATCRQHPIAHWEAAPRGGSRGFVQSETGNVVRQRDHHTPYPLYTKNLYSRKRTLCAQRHSAHSSGPDSGVCQLVTFLPRCEAACPCIVAPGKRTRTSRRDDRFTVERYK